MQNSVSRSLRQAQGKLLRQLLQVQYNALIIISKLVRAVCFLKSAL